MDHQQPEYNLCQKCTSDALGTMCMFRKLTIHFVTDITADNNTPTERCRQQTDREKEKERERERERRERERER